MKHEPLQSPQDNEWPKRIRCVTKSDGVGVESTDEVYFLDDAREIGCRVNL